MTEIKKKGFDMVAFDEDNQDQMKDFIPTDFSRVGRGVKALADAVFKIGDYQRFGPRIVDRESLIRAIHNGDIGRMRELSDFFYRTSGIYQRLCRYMAYMYRYDWCVTPYYNDNVGSDKIKDGFKKVLFYLDNFQIKKFFGQVALKVVKNGCYYGYVIFKQNKIVVQQLPINYCRARFFSDGQPLIEFNMKYFDDAFSNSVQRMQILKTFPPEFEQGYKLYKKNKLTPDFPGDENGWYFLTAGAAIKFNLNGEDFPPFISVIPAIIDLDDARALDKKKMLQQLLKIIIQKMPIDKNGDLVFDVDEAQQLHNNAVQMLSKAVGVDVLTTFAEVDVADMADDSNTAATDTLQRVERSVFNEAGVSQMQFNTDGNLALEKSILNDEASLWNLIQQFETFLNILIKPFNNKKLYYKVQILPTTIYNYKDLAKQYKEHTQLGYSKMLPQIALGQSQSSILATAYFENDILDLVNVFIPPLMSSTMNAEILNRNNDGTGRPEKSDDEKSPKTLQNEESMN